MDQKDLQKVLDCHEKWLIGDNDGIRANLRGADLSGANLSGASLSYANLRGALGLLLLPVQDSRGYSFPHAVQCRQEWRIRVGCRDFSIAEARAHWGSADYSDRQLGDDYLYAVEWLEKRTQA